MNSAVVVGLCAHGLAITRALANNGVEVVAAESNMRLPGCTTNKAKVVRFSDINGQLLIDDLVKLGETRKRSEQSVLFLTNDRMVRRVGEQWAALKDHYLLSWGSCTENVIRLLDKRQIEKTCNAAEISYPKSMVVNSVSDRFDSVLFPAIVKPSNPLGAFKAIIVKSDLDLSNVIEKYPSSLPFLLQQWIPGDDEHLMVSAILLDNGRVLARFDGRKLASHPRLVGQTSVMEPRPNDRVFEIAKRFFAHANVSGPAAIEVKKGANDEYFVIEPTVGRSDYFVDAMISNGVNFPYSEYRLAIGSPTAESSTQDRAVWFDTERDKACFVRLQHRLISEHRFRWPVFPYLRADDMRPWLVSQKRWLSSLWSRLLRRIRSVYRKKELGSV